MKQFLFLSRRKWLSITGLAAIGVSTFVVWAWAFSSYSSYLQASHDCIKALRSGSRAQTKAEFDANADMKAIISGSRTSYSGCDTDVLQISAKLMSGAYDCAKLAVELRNQYAKATGSSPVVKNVHAEISTALIAEPGKLRSKLTYRPVDLKNPWEDPSIKGLQPGDMLYFKNERCTERSSSFMGHVMTVVSVNYSIFGKPKSVTVLEGHTNSNLPTYRTLNLDQIFKNGRGETSWGILNVQAINDISCCVFKGVTTFNDEARLKPMLVDSTDSAGEENPNATRTRSVR